MGREDPVVVATDAAVPILPEEEDPPCGEEEGRGTDREVHPVEGRGGSILKVVDGTEEVPVASSSWRAWDPDYYFRVWTCWLL